MSGIIRPELKGVKREVVEYIDKLHTRIAELEQLCDGYNNNGAVKFGVALNGQLDKLATQLNDADINFESTEDKIYERFLNTLKIFKDVISDIQWFNQAYGDQIKEDSDKKIPAIERMVRKI